MKMICPSCKEEVIDIYMVSWAHKSYSTCTLSDGLELARFPDPNDEKYIMHSLVVKDPIARRFFIEKFDLLEKEQNKTNDTKEAEITEIGNEIVISQNKGTESDKRAKKRQFLSTFKPYYE